MSDKNISESKYPSTFYRVSLKAIIRDNEGRILVVKESDSTTWNLPGGGMDHGESEKEALARELFEEVCYRGDFDAKPLTIRSFWVASKQAYLLWIVYEVKTSNQNFSVGEHCSEVTFIDIDQLSNPSGPAEQWIYNYLKDK